MADELSRWARAADLFDELVELAAAEREPRLRALDSEDPALAAEVRAMLAADDRAEGLLEHSLGDLVPEISVWETPVGLRLGAYRLVRPLGEGGMGEVWLAERADGEYHQHVAIKLLKRGIDTQAVLRRFLQERSILARLNHPGIVRLLDGGMSLDGRPWYAMDHVEGEGIVEFASRRALSVAERVDLLVQVADAVAYAHAQLVVHRDLKPGNIIVDSDGATHLLDFGIAKLLEDTGDFTVTATAMRLLSPAYAAPEQILGEPVGTATDVYALGVVAFQLLTGQLPHRRQSRDPALLAHTLAQPPERASSVLARAGAGQARVLYGESADAQRLSRRIAGDLDVVLAKALQREPERRYATVSSFADDLRRWRTGRVVAARPDRRGYRLRSFVRRHRWGVAAATALLVILIAGFSAALWQAGRARQQAQRAELVKQFVLSLFREQDPVARAQAQARSPRDLVVEGIERARRELSSDPRLRLDVLADLGALPAALGDPALSEEVLRQVVEQRRHGEGSDALATARVEVELGSVVLSRGEPGEALALLEHAAAVIARELGPDSEEAAHARGRLARAYVVVGERARALDMARSAHATMQARRGPGHIATLELLGLLGTTLEQNDRFQEAEDTWRKVLEGFERTLGEDHARLTVPLANLGTITRSLQKYPESAAYFARGVSLARRHLGGRHPLLGTILTRQGDVLRRMGDFEGAEAALEEGEQCLADAGAQLGQLYMNRGALKVAQRRHAEAADAYAESQRLFTAHAGEGSPYTWLAAMERGVALMTTGDLDAAATYLELALDKLERLNGRDSYDSGMAAGRLSRLRRLQGRYAEALGLGRHHIDIVSKLYGPTHANTSDARFDLALTLRASGATGDAREVLDDVLRNIQPGTSTATLAPEIHLESARLAVDEGDRARARRDAAAALALLGEQRDPEPSLLAEARQLASAR